jgi:hypothetical protein
MHETQTLILTVLVTMLVATVPFDLTFGQTKANQKAAEIPSDLLVLLQNNLKADELEETKSCLVSESESE